MILVIGVIVYILPSKPDFDSESGTIASQTEYYYNDNDIEDESLLPNDLNSILSDKTTVPLDTNPNSKPLLSFTDNIYTGRLNRAFHSV